MNFLLHHCKIQSGVRLWLRHKKNTGSEAERLNHRFEESSDAKYGTKYDYTILPLHSSTQFSL